MEKLSALANDSGGKASRNLWGMCIEEFLTNFPFILLLNLEIPRVKMMMEGMCGSCYCCSGLGLVEIVVRS